MSLSTVEAAERGHPKAIAATIRHVAVREKLAEALNVRAFYKPKGEHLALVVVVRTETPPNAALCVKVVRRIVQRFQVHRFVPRVIIHGLLEERKQPVWSKVVRLREWSAEAAIVPLGVEPASPRPKSSTPADVAVSESVGSTNAAAHPTRRRQPRGFSWRNLSILLAVCVAIVTVVRAIAGVLGGGMVGVPNAVAGLLRPVTRLVSQRANLAIAGMQPRLDASLPTDWSRMIPSIAPPPLPPELTHETVTIAAVGDIVPGTDYPTNRLPADPDNLFAPTADALRSADLTFGNFESVLTSADTPTKDVSQPGTFAFRAPPFFAQTFQIVGFDVLNVANNHSYDFGDRGLDDTYRAFNGAGIDVIGGDRSTILVRQVNDISIAFLAFSPYEAHNSVNDLERARAIVREADDYADLVVVSMHIGAEGTDAQRVTGKTETFFGENRGNPREFARAVVDAGADLVLGHGPHVLRAVEVYKGRAIAYSLGNFIGYGTLSNDGDTQFSTIFKVELARDGELLGGRLIPLSLAGDGIPRIDPNGGAIERVRSLTRSDFPETSLQILDDGQVTVLP